jgi:RNA polymerase sigma-70 factor (ECF subfamily)
MLPQYQQAIEQYRQRVYSYAHYSLRGREDAEDVTQEVFIKLWQHWRKIDHSKLSAWLMRVAHNAVIDKVRKQKNGDDKVDDYAEVEQQGQRHDPGQELDQESFKAELLAAIKGLDEPFRSIVIMRDIQGLSYTEIQETLEISGSQVKVYLHRGRRKLRDNPALRDLFSAWTGSALQKRETAGAGSHQAKPREIEQ